MNLFCNSDFENYNMTTIINMSTFQYITYVKYISTDQCWHTNSTTLKYNFKNQIIQIIVN